MVKVPFSPPHIDNKIITEVVDALQSGWITTGPKTKEFERRLASFVGISNVLCVSSNSAGLELMLRWFGVQPGDEVIVPAYTYCATANVVVHCGATPVMVDVNSDFNIAVENVKKAITPKTKVIMPVDIGGFPCDYDELISLVKEEKMKSQFTPQTEEQNRLGRILILSDSAHSIGAWYKGKRAGSMADLSVFSFHAVKNLTTAEGGAICLNLPQPFDNQELYKKLCVMSLHGQSKDALAKTQIGNWRYDVEYAGYKCNMPDVLAAMGLVELDRYEEILNRRQQIFDRYSEAFSRYPCFEIPKYINKNKISSFHVYLLRIKDITESERDEIMQKIFEQEVSVNVHFIPLPMLTAYKSRGYDISQYPITYQNYSREISLPVYYTLTDEQVEIVIEAVLKSCKCK